MRSWREAPPAGGAGARRAPAADCFARITLLMSLAAAVLVTACLVLVSGGLGSVRPLLDIATNYYPVVIAAAAAVPCITPLLRALRVQQNARGGAAHAERATTITNAARSIGLLLTAAAIAILVGGGLGSVRPLVDFAAKYYPIVIAAAAAGAVLLDAMPLLRVLRKQRNAHGRAARVERTATTRHTARSIGLPLVVAAAVCTLIVGITSGACVGIHELRPSPAGFTSMAVAIVVDAALLLLVGLYPRARNNAAAVGGGVAAPALAAAPRTRGALAR